MNKFKFEKAVLMIGLGICLAMFISSIVIAVYCNKASIILEGIPFLCYSSFIMMLIAKNRVIKKHLHGGAALTMVLVKMTEDLSRYEKMYGKLPEEETKEEGTNEEKKEE